MWPINSSITELLVGAGNAVDFMTFMISWSVCLSVPLSVPLQLHFSQYLSQRPKRNWLGWDQNPKISFPILTNPFSISSLWLEL